MKYRTLRGNLEEVAEAALGYFEQNSSIRELKIEAPAVTGLRLRPTLNWKSADYYRVCVVVTEVHMVNEVSKANKEYLSEHLLSFLKECKAGDHLVKLWIAAPSLEKGSSKNIFSLIEDAKKHGVGIVEVLSDTNVKVHANPLSPLHVGVRQINMASIPKLYRDELGKAQSTYLDGNPVSGCQALYSVIEGLTRKIAKQISRKDMWKSDYKIRHDRHVGWSDLRKIIMNDTDRLKMDNTCPGLIEVFSSDFSSAIKDRNAVSHTPESEAEYIEREKRLLNIFESGEDLFRKLIKASKPLFS